jgi:hypothetical protein
MTRLSRFGAIVAVVLLICAGLSLGLFAIYARTIGAPVLLYAQYAIGDLFNYVQSSLTRPSTAFRFENYDVDELDTAAAMAEAAEADLYELFPKGTETQPFVDLMSQLGETCHNLERPDKPLSCGYDQITWTKIGRVHIHWSIDVFRDESGEKIGRFRISVTGYR